MTTINKVIEKWQKVGPIVWAEKEWILDDGKHLVLEPWQKAVLEAWMTHRVEIRTLAISNIKKTGKTLLNAVFLAWRWLALPGQHFTVGNDMDQSTARQFSMILEMVQRSPHLSQDVKITQKELTFLPTGSRLTALAADAAGNAGANHLTASHTEAWGVIYENGIRAWEELTPPPGRTYGLPAIRIADSYAGFENESKTWHSLVDRILEGEKISEEWPIYKLAGQMLFHMEGEEARERCFRGTPGEAAEYYADQQVTLRPAAFTRMHSNQRTAGESAFLPDGVWDACYSVDVKPLLSNDKRKVVLGADASTSRDLTALVGVWANENLGVTDVVYTRVWKPQKTFLRLGRPTVDLEETIGAEVMRLHQAGQLAAVVCDPFQLHSLLVSWEKAGIRVIELPQTSGRIEADQSLYDAALGRMIRHYADPVLDDHMRNAVALETPRGFRLAKEKASLKIDAAVALSMAHYGSLERGKFSDSVEYMPNIWEYEGDEVPLMFYKNTAIWNKDPHKEGITWQNCKYRTKGCLSCMKELEREGWYDRPDQQPTEVTMTEEEARREYWNMLNHPQSDPREERAQRFIDSIVRDNKNKRNRKG